MGITSLPLFLGMLSLGLLQAPYAQAQEPFFTIRFGTCDTTLDARSLSTLHVHAAQVENRDGVRHTFAGPRLIDVLNEGCPALKEVDKRERVTLVVRVISADGYSAAVTLMEADTTFSPTPALLALTMDGRPLDEHNGPVKLIVPGDRRQGRHVRRVSRLVVGP